MKQAAFKSAAIAVCSLAALSAFGPAAVLADTAAAGTGSVIIKNVEGIHRTFLQFLAAIAILIPYVAASGGLHLGVLDAAGWASLLTVGAIHTGVAYCLYFSALRHLTGQRTAILSYADPLVACLLSVTVLGEAMSPRQVLGGALILGFTLWNEL